MAGQVEGRATLQSDRGDETQALFRYQWSAGVVLLAAAVGCRNKYRAIWCEHHDDLLGELDSGAYHAIQVKTDATPGATWRCNSKPFIDCVRKFVVYEVAYGPRIEQYILYSNIAPYVPAGTAKKTSTLGSSPMRLCDECRSAPSHDKLVKPYCDAFSALAKGAGADPGVLFKVLRKLEFQKGVPLEGFKEHVSTVIGGLEALQGFLKFTEPGFQVGRDHIIAKMLVRRVQFRLTADWAKRRLSVRQAGRTSRAVS